MSNLEPEACSALAQETATENTNSEQAHQNSPKPAKEIIARMFEIREERRRISERDSDLHNEFRELEADLLRRAETEGLDKFSIKGIGTAIVSDQVLPNVTDWDAYLAWEIANEMQHLRQRRIATAAFRELIEAGEAVPGITPYTQKQINLRAS